MYWSVHPKNPCLLLIQIEKAPNHHKSQHPFAEKQRRYTLWVTFVFPQFILLYLFYFIYFIEGERKESESLVWICMWFMEGREKRVES